MAKRTDLKAVVADRGQVTIPKALRDNLGIKPGTILRFELKDRKLIITKELPGDPVAAAYGCLKGRTAFQSTDQYISDIRGEPD